MAGEDSNTALVLKGHERRIEALEELLRANPEDVAERARAIVALLADRDAVGVPGGLKVGGNEKPASRFPPELLALSACADELEGAEEPCERLRALIRMKKLLLGPAARAARRAGLRQHSKVIARLQIALPAVRGENMTDEELEAVVYATRLAAAEEISQEESRRVGRLMRKAQLDVTQLSQDG